MIPDTESNPHTTPAKNLARWLYLAHAACFLLSLGLLSIIPLIFNYVKRDEASGTFVYSHHGWQIRSFWWYLVWMVLGLVAVLAGYAALFLLKQSWWGIGVGGGAVMIAGAWIWKAYRLLKGFIDLNNNKAMPV